MTDNQSMQVRIADYQNQSHADTIVELMSIYALDPMGGGNVLSDFSQQNLIDALHNIQGAFTVLAYSAEKAVGLVNCMPGFSTFSCLPLINIHDVIVVPQFRGRNLNAQMFSLVEEKAISLGCCKITLEVLEGNKSARKAYQKFGFTGYELDPAMGQALFWEKKL